MRLSEAIRAGCTYGVQVRAQYVLPRRPGPLSGVDTVWGIGSCALGAAALGSGWLQSGQFYIDVTEWLEERWPGLLSMEVDCPAHIKPICSGSPASVERIIMHLNDHHKWTREQIADWVATLEPVAPEIQAAAEALVVAALSRPIVVEVPEEELVCV